MTILAFRQRGRLFQEQRFDRWIGIVGGHCDLLRSGGRNSAKQDVDQTDQANEPIQFIAFN